MRDKAKKYLIDAYLADWAPKPVVPSAGSTSQILPAPRPPKTSRGFLDDTDDDDDDEEEDDEGKYCTYICCNFA